MINCLEVKIRTHNQNTAQVLEKTLDEKQFWAVLKINLAALQQQSHPKALVSLIMQQIVKRRFAEPSRDVSLQQGGECSGRSCWETN